MLKSVIAVLAILFLSLPAPLLASPSLEALSSIHPTSAQTVSVLELSQSVGTSSALTAGFQMPQSSAVVRMIQALSSAKAIHAIAPPARPWLHPVLQWIQKMFWMVTRQLQLITQKKQTVNSNLGKWVTPLREEEAIVISEMSDRASTAIR